MELGTNLLYGVVWLSWQSHTNPYNRIYRVGKDP